MHDSLLSQWRIKSWLSKTLMQVRSLFFHTINTISVNTDFIGQRNWSGSLHHVFIGVGGYADFKTQSSSRCNSCGMATICGNALGHVLHKNLFCFTRFEQNFKNQCPIRKVAFHLKAPLLADSDDKFEMDKPTVLWATAGYPPTNLNRHRWARLSD